MKHTVKIVPAEVVYDTENNLLDDALAQSLHLSHSCKTGDCGACSAVVVSGTVENENGDLVESGSILTCQSKAVSDVVLQAEYFPELADIRQQTLPCKVSELQKVTDSILVIRFRFPPAANLEFLPGQYIDLMFNGIKRSYSIASPNFNEKVLELHIRKVEGGKMSTLLFDELKQNQLMRIEGPKGTFFVRENDKPLIFLATGTGIAPVKSMVESLVAADDPREIYIYWGMRYERELYCDELTELAAQHKHVHFIPVLSREKDTKQKARYVQNAVAEDFDSLSAMEVYACGSVEMIEQAKQTCLDMNLSPEAFHSDAFTPAQ